MLNRMLVLLITAPLLVGCAATFSVVDRPPQKVVVQEGYPPGELAALLGIPPGHLPPPGGCRIWFPGRPPGHQPPSGECSALAWQLPPGAWLLSRPARLPELIHVTISHASEPNVIVAARLYEADTGRFVRDLNH
jgi:hypothetical protein